MRFYTYALEFEVLVFFVLLFNINNFFYIDVGANDPTHLSVTRAFYERGG